MTQQYTPAQLEAWAGLGPWRWQETRTNFETETALVHKDAGIVLNASWRPSSCEIQVSDPDSEALIAAAPDLARLVLEKEKEIARLKAALKPFVDATRLADLRRLENDDVLLKLTWPSKKGHTCLANLAPCQIEAARQAMKKTSDD